MYVIAASPLAKIFQTGFVTGSDQQLRWTDFLMKRPEAVFEEMPFEIKVRRATGGITLQYMVPKQIIGRDEGETRAIVEWLTGGDNHTKTSETMCYGIVPFDPGIDVMGTVSAMIELDHIAKNAQDPGQREKAAARRKSLEETMMPTIVDAKRIAQQRANERVMAQIRTVFRNLTDQYEKNKEQGLGLYTPSPVEFLCTYVLRNEIEASKEGRREINDTFVKMMNETKVVAG